MESRHEPGRNPWGKSNIPSAPDGAEEAMASAPERPPSPRRGEIHYVAAHHGFRCAPPVATVLGPVGAKKPPPGSSCTQPSVAIHMLSQLVFFVLFVA